MDIVVEQVPEPQSETVQDLIAFVQKPTQADTPDHTEPTPEVPPDHTEPQPKKRGRPQAASTNQK